MMFVVSVFGVSSAFVVCHFLIIFLLFVIDYFLFYFDFSFLTHIIFSFSLIV